jgi:hypothetical protein
MSNDDIPEELKSLLQSGIFQLLQQLGGGGGLDVSAMSPEDKAFYEKTNARIQERFDEMMSTCFLGGVTAVGIGRDVMHVSTYGGDSVYDNLTTYVGGIDDDVCMHSQLTKLKFAPDSDNELYAEKLLRPDGVIPSVIARIFIVKREVPAMYAGAFPKKEAPTLREQLFSAWNVEFLKVHNKKLAGDGLHHHLDLELLVRQEYESEFLIGSSPLKIPALPVDHNAKLDFIESLTFMDENPASGG